MFFPKRISRSVLANYLGQGWAALMALAFLPVYIGKLGIEAYGLIGFFTVLQSLLSVFDLGVTPTLTRQAARFSVRDISAEQLRNLVRTFEYLSVVGASALFAVVAAASDHLAVGWVHAQAIPPSAVAHAITITGAIFAARLVEGIYRGVLLGLDQQVEYNLLTACIATVRYAGAVVILHFGAATIEAFFAWQALMSFVSLISLMWAAYIKMPKTTKLAKFSGSALHSVWRFSAGKMAISSISIAMTNVDKIILSHALSLDQFGNYALAGAAASSLYTLVVPITQAFFPTMVAQATIRDGYEGMVQAMHLSSQLVAVLVGVAAITLSVFALHIMYIWSGDWTLAAQTSPYLRLLAIAAFANCLGHIGVILQLARGATQGVAMINLIMLLISAFSLWWTVKAYGRDRGVLRLDRTHRFSSWPRALIGFSRCNARGTEKMGASRHAIADSGRNAFCYGSTAICADGCRTYRHWSIHSNYGWCFGRRRNAIGCRSEPAGSASRLQQN